MENEKYTTNILVNSRFLTQRITGVQRVALEIIKAIEKVINNTNDFNQFSFSLISPKNTLYSPVLKHISFNQWGRLSGHLWEQVELSKYARNHLLINFCSTAPLLKKNQIVTIHDATVYAYPQTFSWMFRTWYRFLLSKIGKRAKRIITVSEFSKNELIKHCKFEPEKLEVIYNGCDHILASPPDTSIINKNNLLDKPYVLAVSSLSPHKNFPYIIHTLDLLKEVDINLVIAGGANPKVFAPNKKLMNKNVKYVGYVNDSQLRALYEHAMCFAYPSFYEGFGIPPLEAMLCRCPVIVSKAASLPEICEDSALYCDPNDPSSLAQQINKIVANKTLREEMISKGFERAKLFTWEKSAQKTLKLIQNISYYGK